MVVEGGQAGTGGVLPSDIHGDPVEFTSLRMGRRVFRTTRYDWDS